MAQARPISGSSPQNVHTCRVLSRSSTTLGSWEEGSSLKSGGHWRAGA